MVAAAAVTEYHRLINPTTPNPSLVRRGASNPPSWFRRGWGWSDSLQEVIMPIIVKPSDFKFKYPRDIANRDEPKFTGLPDPAPFNRDDLYEIVPMMAAVMDDLESTDGEILNMLEDLLNQMPRFIISREEVFDYLTGSARECMR
jgi:hypothetical protein